MDINGSYASLSRYASIGISPAVLRQLAGALEKNAPSSTAVTGTTAANAEGAATQSAGATSADVELTLEDYKQSIRDRIGSFTLHPSQMEARHSISIPDALLEKMRQDPELEESVLSQIENDMAADFVVPPAFIITRFDENGVYSGSAGGSAHMDVFERESVDSFWRREPSAKEEDEKAARDKKRKEIEELFGELAALRRRDQQRLEQNFHEFLTGGALYLRTPETRIRPSVISSLL